MILDSLTNADAVSAAYPALKKAFTFLASLPADAPLGKTVIDDDTYANVMEYDACITGNASKLEGHRQYIDVQAVLSGREAVAWEWIADQEIAEEYSAEKDVLFVRADGNAPARIELKPGLFAVFFPQDGHYGKFASVHGAEKIRKVVVKVRIR